MKCAELNEQNFKLKNTFDMKTLLKKIAETRAFFIRIVRHSYLLKQANNRLNEQEFYEKMQWYRFVHTTNQEEVTKAFEDVKEWIRNNYA